MIKIMLGSIPHQKLSFLSFTYLRTSRNYAWGCWYVSAVSIIFDCSMPILYNFHILLATFYTIFGTNILIQCPVPVPVCCMFFVSQKPHIKLSPNGIKMDGELFWNICDFWEVKSTRDGARGGHEAGGVPGPTRRAPNPHGPLVRRLLLYFGRKKANFWKKIWAKVSIQSELQISRYKRNGARAES